HQLVRDHGPQVVRGQLLELVDLVRGPEAVKEMDERDPRLKGSRLGDQGEVLNFLHRVGAEHGPTRGPGGHDVALVAEDRQAVGGRVRAAMWKTVDVSSPAILYMLGIMRSRPCDAVNVVVSAPPWSAPWQAPAAPPSCCISMTVGTTP